MSEPLANIRVVLVEPAHPGNIGAAARAMKTMGLSRLVLVRPQRFPDPQAMWRAAGAKDVLSQARQVQDFSAAIADCQFVAGTTARARRMAWQLSTPRMAAPELIARATSTQVALVFGREADGLDNDELDLCHLHLGIPVSDAYGSLNLAMAVQVLCYELRLAWLQAECGEQPTPAWDRPAASMAQLEALYAHYDDLIGRLEFLPDEHHSVVMRRIRRMMSRIEPDVTEVSMWRGLLSAIDRQLAKTGR